MYVHLVYSPEVFTVASGRKSTRKRFRQAIELMDLIDHELVADPTSPPFASLPSPLHMGILLSLVKRRLGVFWDTHSCEKTKLK